MIDYIELHARSNRSILNASSSAEDLVKRAVELHMTCLGLVNDNVVYDAPHFVRIAQKAGIKPILGAELTLHDHSCLTLLVKNEQGWRNLSAMISVAQHNAPKGESLLPEGGLEGHTDGLIALSGGQLGRISSAVLHGNYQAAVSAANEFIRLFGKDHFWFELQHHLHPKDNQLVADLVDLAGQIGIGVVATNNVHYAVRDRHKLHDVLRCIHYKTTLDEATQLNSNSEYYLKAGEDLAPLFRAYPHALSNTRSIAEQCNFELPNGLQELPIFPTPEQMSADEYLRQLCVTQAAHLQLPTNAYDQIDYELRVIRESGLSNYFLIVWDIVRFAREQDIMCQGRGSAANSLVAYLLGISPVNPLAHDLVFERFLSSERQVVPDIDIDFDGDRREEVIQYVYQRYGLDYAAMACTFVTFHAKSAIRDIGKALGLPIDLLGHITSTLDTYHADILRESASLQEAIGNRIGSQTWQHILDLCEQVEGALHYLGIHNGGMVITGALISDRVPTEPARMIDRYVVQWDKDGLADVGMVKVDILGLMTLTAITDALKIIEQRTGHRPVLSTLNFDDPLVYDMICVGDTVGIFQVESRAQAQILPRLKPRDLDTLKICISIIRPGPVGGGMAKEYVFRSEGVKPVIYFHPLLEGPLKKTLGVLIFQEDCIRIAHDFASFTPGQGELLRRAFGAKDAHKKIESLHQAFIEGAVAKGVDIETAETVFDMLRAFGHYSFSEAHAASFATLVYYVAWLKRYHPQAFYIALLNNQPMGFWTPAILVEDARQHNIPIYGVDINKSEYRCTVKWEGIQLGFNYVQQLGEADADQIIQAREQQPFVNLEDYYRRVQLSRQVNENLIAAGAMDAWDQSRRDLLWALGLLDKPDKLALRRQTKPTGLPQLTTAEKAQMEYRVTHVSTGPHPMAFYRTLLNKHGTLTSQRLNRYPEGRRVWVAGQIVVHQSPPTAKGFHFITLRDERGFINLILKPKVYAQFRHIIQGTSLLLAKGKVQRQGAVTNLIVEKCVLLNEQILTIIP
ncbi:MAG: error-prone DNA polymerase [Anaerolineae bacterium]|nr:error-prone DNA polymerase [Anaerolineae bacterium]